MARLLDQPTGAAYPVVMGPARHPDYIVKVQPQSSRWQPVLDSGRELLRRQVDLEVLDHPVSEVSRYVGYTAIEVIYYVARMGLTTLPIEGR